MKTFRYLLESLKAGNFFRDDSGKLIKIEKIADGKLHLAGGDAVPRKGTEWTGKKKDGQAIWAVNKKAGGKKSLGKVSRTI
jgi:hypothetical protein